MVLPIPDLWTGDVGPLGLESLEESRCTDAEHRVEAARCNRVPQEPRALRREPVLLQISEQTPFAIEIWRLEHPNS